MDENANLSRVLSLLRESVSEFPIGAVSLDDYKPVEEKIQDLRVVLKCLNSRVQRLRMKVNSHTLPQPPEQDQNELDQIQNVISQCLINSSALMSCFYSEAAQNIFIHGHDADHLHKQMEIIMQKLLTINDNISTSNERLSELLDKKLELEDACGRLVTEFHKFLKKQETIRNAKLGESNPEEAKKREKQIRLVSKINIMKKLITNFISSAGPQIRDNQELQDMLEKHRDLVSIDTIQDMTKDRLAQIRED